MNIPKSPTWVPPLIFRLALFDPHIPSAPLWPSTRLDLLPYSSEILHIAPRNDPVPQNDLVFADRHVGRCAVYFIVACREVDEELLGVVGM